jgi:ketosteroid isomerase-like protein
MTNQRAFLAGAGVAVAARAALPHLVLVKFRRDVRRLNAGDYKPLLKGYADDAVLRFNDGDHRWAGDHHGKPAIDRFLANFTRAGLTGELRALWLGGPPWAMTLVARFDDRATGPDGELLYSNRVVMVVRTRWGRIVEHEDFYLDTVRMSAFEQRLRELGIEPVDGDPVLHATARAN